MPEPQPPQVSDTGLQAIAGIAGAGLVLTLGLSALWATSAPEPATTPVVASEQPAEPALVVEQPPAAVVSLYDDESGAHDTPGQPAPAEGPHATTSLFDTR